MALQANSSGNSNAPLAPLYELEPSPQPQPRRGRLQNALYRQRWLALGLLVACLVAAAVLSYRIRPYYKATAAIIVSHPNLHPAQITPVEYPQPMDPDREMQTELTILRSRAVALPVIEQLNLEQRDPTIRRALAQTRQNLAKKGKTLSPADADAIAYDIFNAKLSPVPDKLSQTVHVSFSAHNPALAAEIVNATDQSFLAETLAERGARGLEASHWMRRQVQEALAQLHQDDAAVAAFQRRHAYVPMTTAAGAQSVLLARLADANHAYSSAEAAAITNAAALASYAGDVTALPAGMSNPAVLTAVTNLGASQKQLSTLEATYQPDFPLVVEAQAQLQQAQRTLTDLKAQVIAGLRQRLADSEQSVTQLHSLVEQLNRQAAATSGLEMQFGVLQERATAQRALAATLREKLNEVQLQASLPPSNIEVLDPALPPGEPMYPRLGLDLALGLGLGIVVGVGAAVAREHWSGALTSGDEVKIELGPALAPLGMIAERRPLRGGACALLPASGSGDAEGYRKIAANLVARCGIPPRVILVTSPNPGEGKTTSVCQLGQALARAGWRTLLLDADVIRPGCHRFFGLSNANGLAAAQTGRKTAPLAVAPHLDLMPAEDDAPPLQMRAVATLLEQWREHYDYVLVDSPPGQYSGEAVLLSSLVDGVVVVLRWGQTRLEEARPLCEDLARAHAPLLGTIFQRADPGAPSFRPYRRSGAMEA
ncbi:MAG: GumC family protein [Terriglobales bacterium]